MSIKGGFVTNIDFSEELTRRLKSCKRVTCVIKKDGEILYEYYHNKKNKQSLQRIRSCSKSVTGILFGICMDRGLIKDVNVPLTEYFGDILRDDPDPRKRELTLYHLLSMSAGFDWPEFGEWDCYAQMTRYPDIPRFILERDLIEEPGTRMNYNSGCTHLLGCVIQQVTGESVSDFARHALFEPLGIKEYNWFESQGQCLTADGLRLKTEDMLKIGELCLHHGRYQDKQIVSEQWICDSMKLHFHTYDGMGSYGYQWWVSSVDTQRGEAIPFYFALGFGGQFIIVVPAIQMVIALTSFQKEDSMLPLEILKEVVIRPEAEGEDQL